MVTCSGCLRRLAIDKAGGVDVDIWKGRTVMVARTRPDRRGLIVVFSRDGEEPEELPAADSYQAAARAITFGSFPAIS
jgi:hypothetical protein